jgi:GxxExxY protein
MTQLVSNQNLLYPELSYKIIGCAYEVFNEIGGGHKEIVFHKGLSAAFRNGGLTYKENLYTPVKFHGETIGKNYFDFLVDEKVVVEIKSSDRFTKSQFDQLTNYLNVSNLKLGILILFTREAVKFKRVLNLDLLNKEKTTPHSNLNS